MRPSYSAAMVGVATAKTPCGPYTYKSSFKPLGADSRDEGLFQNGMYSLLPAIQSQPYSMNLLTH